MSRIVALDHGTRRIGVAVAEIETGMAFARPALQRRSEQRDLAVIGDLCAAESAALVVIGLPLNMDGTEGPQAAAARAFGEQLRTSGLEVVYEDERLSSWEAAEQLKETGQKARRGSGDVDSTAARLILQQYLDARSSPGRLEETE